MPFNPIEPVCVTKRLIVSKAENSHVHGKPDELLEMFGIPPKDISNKLFIEYEQRMAGLPVKIGLRCGMECGIILSSYIEENGDIGVVAQIHKHVWDDPKVQEKLEPNMYYIISDDYKKYKFICIYLNCQKMAPTPEPTIENISEAFGWDNG